MGKILTIARKEIATYFTTPIAYVIFTVFALISGYFFLQILAFFQFRSIQYMTMRMPQMLEHMNLNDMVIQPLFMNIQVFFLLMFPILTMRLIAEEKRSGTIELLMTAPVKSTHIVLGKYLAALAVVCALIATTLTYCILLGAFSEGGLDWVTIGTGYLGMFLLGAMFAAVGLFTSSVTSSQIVSAVLGFGVLLLFWVIGWAAQSAGDTWKPVLEHLSVLNHFQEFAKGVIRVRDIVYFLSVSVFSLFLAHRFVEAQRWA